MGNSEALDYMWSILHDPFDGTHMGITAENVAKRYRITREMQDSLDAEASQLWGCCSEPCAKG